MGYLTQAVEKAILAIFRTKHDPIPTRDWHTFTNTHVRGELDIKTAEKVVNEYGIALEKASYANRLEMAHLIDNLANGKESVEKVVASLNEKRGRHYDLFTLKCDRSLLPYPKETIREAIDLLLQYEKDPENISLLREGLR